MISCPKCSASLPDWAKTCQFCHADTTAVARPKPVASSRPVAFAGPPQWVWGAYYAISVLYVVEGVDDIFMTFVNSHRKIMGEEIGIGPFGILSIVLGALTILIGLGLVLRIEFIRGIVNFFCGVQILLGILGFFGAVAAALFTGPFGILLMFLEVLRVVCGVMMIYLIGETDKAAPNL